MTLTGLSRKSTLAMTLDRKNPAMVTGPRDPTTFRETLAMLLRSPTKVKLSTLNHLKSHKSPTLPPKPSTQLLNLMSLSQLRFHQADMVPQETDLLAMMII